MSNKIKSIVRTIFAAYAIMYIVASVCYIFYIIYKPMSQFIIKLIKSYNDLINKLISSIKSISKKGSDN